MINQRCVIVCYNAEVSEGRVLTSMWNVGTRADDGGCNLCSPHSDPCVKAGGAIRATESRGCLPKMVPSQHNVPSENQILPSVAACAICCCDVMEPVGLIDVREEAAMSAPKTSRCVCGHLVTAHEHYRAGTDCSLCDPGSCPHFRSAGAHPLIKWIRDLLGLRGFPSAASKAAPWYANIIPSAQ